jgi:Domain of unknown function (DUF4034)
MIRITLLLAVIVTSSACNLAELNRARLRVAQAQSAKRTNNNRSGAATHRPQEIADKHVDDYEREIRQRLAASDFAWIDQEAAKVRLSKERLTGGYWKLRTLYGALEHPNELSSDGAWEDLINKLSDWSNQRPQSVTAKVALGAAWQEYAWNARGNGYADTVSQAAWQTFFQRLERSATVLKEAAALNERCPYWYVIAIWVGMGQQWERKDLDRIFDAGVALEPAFYYLYQAKASYLLPQWGGAQGEWEQFADDSALKLGGHQGDIVFFAIYSQVLSLNGMTFMNSHQQAIPKLIAGFRSIDKLYGSAPHRLNEACFFAFLGHDVATTNELFARIGDDYDESVWRSKQTFDLMRSGAQERAKAIQSSQPVSASDKAAAKN